MDPYRLLFPAALIFGIAGAAVWILFALHALMAYPALIHPDLMIGGFLFVLAAGFLMTALPRYTGSFTARKWELFLAVALCALLGATSTLSARHWHHLSVAAFILFIIVFAARRFRARAFAPPPSFIFVALGLGFGAGGSALLAAASWGALSAELIPFARAIYYQGMMLSLVLGVGTLLITALLGWDKAGPVKIANFGKRPPSSLRGAVPPDQQLFALALLAGFVTEFWVEPHLGRALRAAGASWIAFRYWRLHRRPRNGGHLTFWIWISCWSLLIGLWGYAAWPAQGVHLLHLFFISGLSLLALMIASRVTLAHGNFEVRLERTSRAILWTGILLSIAALSRVLAPVIPARYFSHLAYASAWFIAALLVWGLFAVPRMIKRAN